MDGGTQGASSRMRVVWLALLVAIVAVIPFLPALHNDFVSWDDDKNFLQNFHYRGLGPAQLKWMWTTFHLGHYVPLSWMTLGLDYVVWGMNPFGYHLTNLVLHGANTGVIFLVARRLLATATRTERESRDNGIAAAFAALVFAVHPLRVESVAWATERRDVLSGLLYSLSVWLYLRAIEKEPVSPRRYAPVFVVFLAALLAKATAMTLPAVLLLLNVYPLRRLTWPLRSGTAWRQVAKELTPLAMLSLAAMLLSLLALHPGPQLGVADKLAVSAYGLAFYLLKTVAPLGLGPIYPMPLVVPAGAPAYLAAYAAIATIVFFAALEWRRWPGIAAALVGFVVAVLPMLGAVQNGPQVAADRYTYHPAPAVALLAGAAFLLFWRRSRTATAVGGGGLLLALGALTWVQTGYWRDSESLWRRGVAVAPQSAIAHDGLGTVYFRKDSLQRALAEYELGARLSPNYADVHANIAVTLARLGRYDEAEEHLQHALELKPDFDMAESNYGIILAMQGKPMSAIGHYGLALQINPQNWAAELNWGNALVATGNLEPALFHYRRAAELNPTSVEAEARWGATLAQLGRIEDAIPHFQRAVRLDPSDARAQRLLSRALSERRPPNAKVQ